MNKPPILMFDKKKSAKQNIDILFAYIKKLEKPYSTILLDAFMQDINDDEFRQKIKEDVLCHLKKRSKRL